MTINHASEQPVIERLEDGKLWFDCPGCGLMHAVNIDKPGRPRWTWNGDLMKPTFTPSIRVRWNFGPERTPKVCHSFVTDGQIKFCTDSTHSYAGQTLALPVIDAH